MEYSVIKTPKNPISGKNYEGSHFGGEGKNNLKTTSEPEFTGVYKSAPNPKLNVAAGATSQRDGKEEGRTFSSTTPGYAGPENITFSPKDLGTRNPDTLEHS